MPNPVPFAQSTLDPVTEPGGEGAPIEVYPGAQSVSRAIGLLKAYSDAQPEWTLGDLAQRVGLNKATAHRLLAALESERFIVRNPRTGGYRLGPELIVLGGCAMRSNDLRSVSRPHLEALAEATGETTTLEILSETEVVVLDEVSSRHLLGMSQDVGARLPAHATSTGKLLLAYAGEGALARLGGPSLRRYGPCTVTTLSALRAELAQIRGQGYATTQDELEAGFAAVAAPIFDHSGSIVASASVGGPVARLSGAGLEQAVAHTRQAAAHISQALGARLTR